MSGEPFIGEPIVVIIFYTELDDAFWTQLTRFGHNLRLFAVRYEQKNVTYPHAFDPSSAMEMYFLTAKTYHVMVRKKREKDSIYMVRSRHHMDLPCIKGWERGGLCRFLTYICSTFRQNGRCDHFASSHWSAFFFCPRNANRRFWSVCVVPLEMPLSGRNAPSTLTQFFVGNCGQY
jgi:hypothetical protein